MTGLLSFHAVLFLAAAMGSRDFEFRLGSLAAAIGCSIAALCHLFHP